MRVNEKLAQIVKERGIKQTYLSERTGYSIDTISKILRSERKLTAEEFFVFCKVLELDPVIFMEDDAA